MIRRMFFIAFWREASNYFLEQKFQSEVKCIVFSMPQMVHNIFCRPWGYMTALISRTQGEKEHSKCLCNNAVFYNTKNSMQEILMKAWQNSQLHKNKGAESLRYWFSSSINYKRVICIECQMRCVFKTGHSMFEFVLGLAIYFMWKNGGKEGN